MASSRQGESLLSFKLHIAGFVAFFVLAILCPLLMFTPSMARAKRKGLADYGLLAQRYVDDFERKWVLDDGVCSEELLGAPDIQSLADLGNSYALVRDMRPVPFGLEDFSSGCRYCSSPFAAPAHPLLPGRTHHACHEGSALKIISCSPTHYTISQLNFNSASASLFRTLLSALRPPSLLPATV